MPSINVLPCLLQERQSRRRIVTPQIYPWYHKQELTFSDALAAVRRLLWQQTIFAELDQHDALKQLPRKVRENLLDQLSRAA